MHFNDYLEISVAWKIFSQHAIPLEIVTSVLVAAIVIGLAGNSLLLAFFGKRNTRVYRSRDAMYIRIQAVFDILICLFVLPYAIVYERRLVNINIVCKIFEYLRHSLLYMTHLFLFSYLLELPKRSPYVESVTRCHVSVAISFVLGLLLAMPVLVLFRSGNTHIERISGKALPMIMDEYLQDRTRNPDKDKNSPHSRNTTAPRQDIFNVHLGSRSFHQSDQFMKNIFYPDFCHKGVIVGNDGFWVNWDQIWSLLYVGTQGSLSSVAVLAFTMQFLSYILMEPNLTRNTLFLEEMEELRLSQTFRHSIEAAQDMSVTKKCKSCDTCGVCSLLSDDQVDEEHEVARRSIELTIERLRNESVERQLEKRPETPLQQLRNKINRSSNAVFSANSPRETLPSQNHTLSQMTRALSTTERPVARHKRRNFRQHEERITSNKQPGLIRNSKDKRRKQARSRSLSSSVLLGLQCFTDSEFFILNLIPKNSKSACSSLNETGQSPFMRQMNHKDQNILVYENETQGTVSEKNNSLFYNRKQALSLKVRHKPRNHFLASNQRSKDKIFTHTEALTRGKTNLQKFSSPIVATDAQPNEKQPREGGFKCGFDKTDLCDDISVANLTNNGVRDYFPSWVSVHHTSTVEQHSSTCSQTSSNMTPPEIIQATGKRPVKSILRQTFSYEKKVFHVKLSSYKWSFILLMFLDIVCVTIATMLYLISENHSSFFLNLVHCKSVCSFFVFSLSNRSLRDVTWGRLFKCCVAGRDSRTDTVEGNIGLIREGTFNKRLERRLSKKTSSRKSNPHDMKDNEDRISMSVPVNFRTKRLSGQEDEGFAVRLSREERSSRINFPPVAPASSKDEEILSSGFDGR